MPNTAIRIDQVSKIYQGGVHAVDNINLCIEKGEWVAIMGPSGSGKSTLLNLLDGLDSPSTGSVTECGVDIGRLSADEAATFRRENIGLIFQQFHLVPYLTALENVMVAQYYHSKTDKDQAMRALERVQLAHRAEHLPSQLSGGEQQRVCIARALINDPQIILADEPTGNLDEANEERVLGIFRTLNAEGKTLVVVTHDRVMGEAARRVVDLSHGKIVRDVVNGQSKED
ncbi:MAG: ABC transporter ATP-binding protein [Geobacter sp.]|nr:MAG: ABC transporter ATP-binding protein [Geobacter sp.]